MFYGGDLNLMLLTKLALPLFKPSANWLFKIEKRRRKLFMKRSKAASSKSQKKDATKRLFKSVKEETEYFVAKKHLMLHTGLITPM